MNKQNNQMQEARESIQGNPLSIPPVLYEISQILNCDLDKQTLSILVSLVENGVNPEALAQVVKELRRESSAIQVIIPSECQARRHLIEVNPRVYKNKIDII